jgi:hypothetical protein
LIGKLTFTDEQLDATQQSLEEAGVQMPAFGNIETTLAAELKEPEPTPEECMYSISSKQLASFQ